MMKQQGEGSQEAFELDSIRQIDKKNTRFFSSSVIIFTLIIIHIESKYISESKDSYAWLCFITFITGQFPVLYCVWGSLMDTV